MSNTNCGHCAGQLCTCNFASSVDATRTGNGNISTPANWRPNTVPLPRPSVFLQRRTPQTMGGGVGVLAPVEWTVDPLEGVNSFSPFFFNTGRIDPLPTTRITIPRDGYYQVGGSIIWDTFGGNVHITARIRKNGTDSIIYNNYRTSGGMTTHFYGHNLGTLEQFQAGEYIELLLGNNSAGSIVPAFLVAANYASFWANWVRPL